MLVSNRNNKLASNWAILRSKTANFINNQKLTNYTLTLENKIVIIKCRLFKGPKNKSNIHKRLMNMRSIEYLSLLTI
jgi:hypothetical protein